MDTPSIVATWTASSALNRAYELQYRNAASADGWIAMAVAVTRDRATALNVIVGQTYVVRGRTYAGPQAVWPWSIERDITIEEPQEPEEE